MILKGMGLFLLLAICLTGIEIIRSRSYLQVTHYQIDIEREGIEGDLRIVHLTDLHDSCFGWKNRRLIKKIKKEEPDLILVTGDLINSHKEVNLKHVKDLISKLSALAPCYISLGNQEMEAGEKQGIDFAREYESSGGIVLEASYQDLEIRGFSYRIGGIYGYCQPEVFARETGRIGESDFLKDFQNTDACKILLCHLPVSWKNSYSLFDWDVDLVFSGHVHGGQVRIPFVGGLWAPDFGWFPGELSGVYTTSQEGFESSQKTLMEFAEKQNYDASYYKEHTRYMPGYLILSRGLGNTDWMPRFFNTPEIVVTDLVGKK